MRDIKLTLYDIFGYLLPGIILFLAMAVTFWAFYYPNTTLVFIKLTLLEWILTLLFSYILGHMTQAIANLLFKLLPPNESIVLSKRQKDNLPGSFIQIAKSKASIMLGIDLEKISDKALYTFCDEIILQRGIITDREVLQYRKGFYRGLSISFLILSIAFIFRATFGSASIEISSCIISLNWHVFLFLILFLFTCFLFSFFRYLRFARHRVVRAIMGFLALQS